MADDDIEVEIAEDPPKTPDPNEIGDPVIAAAPEPKTKKPVTDPEAGVDVLKKQLADAQAAKAQSDARAASAEREAVGAKTEVQQTQLQLVENAIAAVKAQLDASESDYADAMAAGDFAAGAKIQRQMAADAAKQLTLENGLESLKNAPKPQAPAPSGDPVEAFAQTLTPPAAAWIRSHPDYVRNAGLNKRLVAAHNDALAWDIVPDTPAYFAHVEGRLGLRSGGQAAPAAAAPTTEVALSDTSTAAGGRGSDTAPPAAPARNGNNGSSRVLRLSPAQQEAAQMSGMSNEEYGKMLLKIEREKTASLN